MPLKLSVGLSRKQGLPNFGSAGATCLVEVELSSDALKEGAVFFDQAEKALEACRVVVEGELARYTQPASRTIVMTSQPESPIRASPDTQEGSNAPPLSSEPPTCRERSSDRPNDRPATQRQLQAIERLALRLGANPSDWLYQRIGETPPHCLSLAEASALIDELQQELPPSSRLAG